MYDVDPKAALMGGFTIGLIFMAIIWAMSGRKKTPKQLDMSPLESTDDSLNEITLARVEKIMATPGIPVAKRLADIHSCIRTWVALSDSKD